MRTGNVKWVQSTEGKSLVNNEDESCKERKKVKVKKKVLVKKSKGEKSSDPIKKDVLGKAPDFRIIGYFILIILPQSQRE